MKAKIFQTRALVLAWVTLAAGAALLPPLAIPAAQAQENIDKLFEDPPDDFNNGNFGAPPGQQPFDPNSFAQPGQPPGGAIPPGTPPGVFSPPADTNANAGFPADSGKGSGTKPVFKPGSRAAAPSKSAPHAPLTKGSPVRDSSKLTMATAKPEDITNENFPDLIDSFDYPNADITDIVKAISQLTKKNFIIDSGVHGKISIIAPTQITVAEAYKAFLSALAANGFTVVPSGKFMKIKQAREAQRDSIETYTGAYYPNSDQVITRIIHLKHISAEEVNKQLLRILPSKNGEMTPYPPTNSLIISDYGANIERVENIIAQLDKPGFDEQLVVIPIRHAKCKEVADLLNKIINKDSGQPNPGGFGAVRPFRPSTGGKAEELSLVQPDERTNAIIVVGNGGGIEKVRNLVKKLDYKLDPADAGGVFVYYVKYGEAEKIAQTLNGLAQGTAPGAGASNTTPGGGLGGGFGSPMGGFGQPGRSASPMDRQAIFGGDVRISPDKMTNSLVITAGKQDYETVSSLLSKLDIPRDQVYVEGVIMELSTDKKRVWDTAYYKFADAGDGTTSGVGRAGFSGEGTLNKVINPTGDAGAILGFGTGGPLKLTLPGSNAGTITIPSLVAFLNFLQTNNESNVLATPQLMVSNNEEAEVEVGQEAPVGQSTSTTGSTQTNSTQREKLTTKLKVTPFISPDSSAVRMKIEIPIKGLATGSVNATNLAQNAIITTTREIKTNIVVHDGDTAVLGGLMADNELITETKIPVLGDIPVLGWLFKSSSIKKNKQNLLVFLTPKIIRTIVDSQKNLVHKAKQRIEWLKQNFGGRDPYGKLLDELPRAEATEEDIKTPRSNTEPIRRR